MLRRKLAESLTVRIFLMTTLILLCAGGITFGLIAWATPSTYTAVINDDLTAQVDALAARLQETAFEDCGPLLDAFIRSSGANVMLAGPDGQIADTGSQLAVQTVYEDDFSVVTISGDSAATYAAERGEPGGTVAVPMSEQAPVTADVRGADQGR